MKYGFLLLLICACNSPTPEEQATIPPALPTSPQLIVLGTAQDAGSPQINCQKDCCRDLFLNPDPGRMVVSLGLFDPTSSRQYLFEATPDLPQQLRKFCTSAGLPLSEEIPDGIFLTHAHIGHYTGLMYLGKEAMNANQVPVYAMPRMRQFLTDNGPWSQLVSNNNIQLQALADSQAVDLGPQLSVTPFTVPHRDEYSETVGYLISGPNKRALFIPDIDKWGKWSVSIVDAIASVDYAFLDATFYDAEEINNRDISQIPHPFVVESLALFADLSLEERAKIHFIHLNHTNPLLRANSAACRAVEEAGMQLAQVGQKVNL